MIRTFWLALVAALLPSLVHAAPRLDSAAWTRAWALAPVRAARGEDLPTMADATVRVVVRLSVGGGALRLRFSNEMSDAPLALGAVRVALADSRGLDVPGSERAVAFGGAPAITIPAGAPAMSDPVALAAAPLARVVVSFRLPGGTRGATVHADPRMRVSLRPGDEGASVGPDRFSSAPTLPALSGIDVLGPARATVVTLGDSITDGAASTPDADRRWPDVLAERLHAAGMAVAVANAGISGNRLITTDEGPAALARLDRDVLAVPGVRCVIVLEGVNDIGWEADRHKAPPTPAALIAAYRQIIARAHAAGLRAIGATILPYEGAGYWREEGERVRATVNDWILRSGEFDAVVDLARALADPADPRHLAPAYDSGDHLHPSDAGYRAMAEAVPLPLLVPPRGRLLRYRGIAHLRRRTRRRQVS